MRKKTLGTVLAVGALALVAVGLGTRLWANKQLNAMPMLWAVHVAPDGRVLVELDDQLYIEDTEGHSQGVVPLSKFGVKGFEGDFAILSDDSVILQKGELPPQNSHDVMRALTRTREEAPDTETAGAVPLQRCSLKTMECTALTGPGDYFKVRRTFKLLVDEQAQRIYVADTDQQRLVMLDYTGKILSSKEGELQFPNELQMTAPGELTVVDTNHNRFVTYAVTPDGIGLPLKVVPQAEWLGIPMEDFLFPTGFVQMANGSQFAIIAGDNLTHGMLFERTSDTEGAKHVPLPEGTDALTLAATDDEVLVPDNGNYRIHAIGLDGTDHGNFGSDVLNERFDEYASQHRIYAAIFSKSLWIMLLVAVPLLFFAVRLQRAAEDGEDEEAAPVARRVVAPGQESVDAAAVRENCFGPGAAGILPLKPASPFEFRRQWGRRALMNSGIGLAIMTIMLLALPASILSIDYSIHLKHPQAPWLSLDWRVLTFCGFCALILVHFWSSLLLERLFLNRTGMGYQSPFSGPLAWLSFLRPSWALRWDEIADIRLSGRGKARSPANWNFLVRDRRGVVRRVSTLAWKLQGQSDGNPQYFPGAWMDEEALRATIHGTALYQLIGGRGQLPSGVAAPAARPAVAAVLKPESQASRAVPFWQTLTFYGLLFWLLVGASMFAEAHLPAGLDKSLTYRAFWQLVFVLVTAGMLYAAVPEIKRGHFMGVHSVLILFFGPLTVPFYLWAWYGWRRALRFTALACVYLIVFGIGVGLVNSAVPGTFMVRTAQAATSLPNAGHLQ